MNNQENGNPKLIPLDLENEGESLQVKDLLDNTPSLEEEEEDELPQVEELDNDIIEPLKIDAINHLSPIRNDHDSLTHESPDLQSTIPSESQKEPSIKSPVPQEQQQQSEENSESEEETQMENDTLEKLKDRLTSLALKKLCPDHNQSLLNICENPTCERRFWCGICCVKFKKLFTRNLEHMTTIDDYIEEKIQSLQSAKSFTADEKSNLSSQIINKKREDMDVYDKLGQEININIDKYKTEIFLRLESAKEDLQAQLQAHKAKTQKFYSELSDQVDKNSVKNLADELSSIEARVTSDEGSDIFEVIKDLGSKVEQEIPDLEQSNLQFTKVQNFVSLLFKESGLLKRNTIPSFKPKDENLDHFIEQFQELLQPILNTTFKLPGHDLQKVYRFYERVKAGKSVEEAGEKLKGYLSLSSFEPSGSRQPQIESVHKSKKKHNRGHQSRDQESNVLLAKLKKKQELGLASMGNHEADPHRSFLSINSTVSHDYDLNTLDNDREDEEDDDEEDEMERRGSQFRNIKSIQQRFNKAHLEDPRMRRAGSQKETGGSRRNSNLKGLQPISNKGSFRETNESSRNVESDFSPVIEMGGGEYLFVTFSKQCPENGEIYGIKIYRISKVKNTSNKFLYSSDEDFMVNKRIVNLCYIFRETDNKEILALSTQEGTIFLMEITFEVSKQKKKKKLAFNLLSRILPYTMDTSITTMHNLLNSEYLFCTTIEGEILVYNTISSDVVSSQIYVVGSINCSCFLGNSGFFAIGSGSETLVNDNSITFLSVEATGQKMKGEKHPSIQSRYKIKKAHKIGSGVLCLAGDNEAELPVVFSCGGGLNPQIKIWNYETRELISTIEAKESFAQYFMNVVCVPQELDFSRNDSIEPKGAWKRRKEEINSYKKIRDEKKRKKTENDGGPADKSEFIVIVATNNCLRTIRVFVQDKGVDTKEIVLDFTTTSEPGTCILQSLLDGNDLMIYACKSLGYVEMFDIKLR